MNSKHWWALLGLSGTSLAALVLGPAVWGQPEPMVVLPPPPIQVVQPDLPKSRTEEPRSEPRVEMPLFPTMPPTVPSGPITMPPPLPKQTGPTVETPPAVPMPTRTVPTTELPPPGPIAEPPPLVPTPTRTVPKAEVPLAFPPPKTEAPPIFPTQTPTVPKTEIAPPLPDANTERPQSFDVQQGKQQSAVTVEWVGPSQVRIHQPLSCQIIVRNASTTPAQNVIVRHRLGDGVTCKMSEPRAGQDVNELVWNLGTLAPQQTKRVEMVLIASTKGALNCQAAVTFTAVAGHQIQVREPKLALKMSSPEKVIAGESITMMLAISNPGDGAAEGIKLKALLPDGVEHPRGKLVEFDIGTLAANETRNMQLVCKTNGGGAQKCEITVNGEGGLVASDSAQFEILRPGLDVAVTGPKLRYLDRHAVYVLKVTNPGNAPASRVEVQQPIPAGFKFHQANSGGVYSEAARMVTWSLGELPAGQSKEIAVDLIPIKAGEHHFDVLARASGGLRSQADARTMVEGLPSLSIEVGHVDDPIEVGAETVFEIRLSNTGTKAETNVEVVCILPEQLEYRGKGSTAIKCRQEGRELIFEPVARLAPKGDVIYRVQVRGTAPGDVRFRTRVKSDSLRDPVLREESLRIYSDEAPARQPAPMAPQPVTPRTSVPAPPGNVLPMPPSGGLPMPPAVITPPPPLTPVAPPPIETPVPR